MRNRRGAVQVVAGGPALAVQTFARRLAPLGAAPVDGADTATGDGRRLVLDWDGGAGGRLDVDVSWYGPARMGDRPGSEATVQAMSGLMQVHGRDAGRPRRLGLEVASVTAGLLAAHGALAAMVGGSRGLAVSGVRTSVLQAGLLLVSHRLAAATAAAEWVPVPPGPAPGPPFRSADGEWFEIETMDASDWRAFWEQLGAADADLQWAWRLFRPRYFRGTCTLPPGLHEATAAHRLSDIARTAAACAVSLRRVRGYEEVLRDWDPAEAHPVVRPLAASSEPDAPGPSASADLRDAALPLTGLRIVEATNRLQGPLAGLLLGMLGAHVVRVEPPGGDLSRTIPPLVDGTGSFFLCFNRGKETVELDLTQPAGRGDLVELAAGADVFLQNWRPGKAAEWGLDAEDLAANPRLVYAHASGWGERADLAHLLGTDFLVQAHAGVAAGISPQGAPALPSRALIADYLGALVTCEAVLSGLFLRERSGRGQRVRSSLLTGALALQAHVVEALAGGREKSRRDGRPLWGLLDQPLATADGMIVVCADDDDGVRRLCRVCGVDPDESRWETIEHRLVEAMAADVTTGWEQRLTRAGIACASACTDLAALPGDPRLSALFEPLAGTAVAPGAPWTVH